MATARAERRLAAIMAADIVGYSRLVEADEAGTLAAIKDLRREVIDPLLAEHHGRIVKLMGDGAIVEFGSVVDAVACAVAVQKGVAAQQAEVPPERRIVFRIGINLGDVVVEGEDLLGDGVNVAARLEQLCEPGGVLVSGTAYDHLQGKLDLPLEFAGEQQRQEHRPAGADLPGAARRRARRVSLAPRARVAGGCCPLRLPSCWRSSSPAGAFWWLRPGEPALTGRPSIAVLPFDNLGGDEATGRLADGITEDIITDLARFREFDVIARNSTAVYKGKPVDVRQVGKDLNVRYVLEGSIQRQGEQIRATAQLIDAATGAHVWSERWDRPAGDVFAVQTEIAEQVASRLGGWGVVIEAERQAARRKRPTDLTAYELYLRGIDEMQPRHQGEHRGGDPPVHAGGREGPEPRPRLDGPGRGPRLHGVASAPTCTRRRRRRRRRPSALWRSTRWTPTRTGHWPRSSARSATSRARRRSSRPRCASTRVTRPSWRTTRAGRARSATRSAVPRPPIGRSG